MCFQKILIALDRTQQADRVFETGISLAQALHANVKLVHCISEPVTASAAEPAAVGAATGWPTATWPALGNTGLTDGGATPAENKQIWQQTYEAAQAWLQHFYEQARDRGMLAVSAECAVGNPAQRLCELAADWQADAIIVGRQGRTGLAEAVLGSVSNHVVHHAPCTVVTVQPREAATGESAE